MPADRRVESIAALVLKEQAQGMVGDTPVVLTAKLFQDCIERRKVHTQCIYMYIEYGNSQFVLNVHICTFSLAYI